MAKMFLDFKRRPAASRIELRTDKVHLILEAKRGWDLPGSPQLAQYAGRFGKDKALIPTIAVVAECSPAWAPTLAGRGRGRSGALRPLAARGPSRRANSDRGFGYFREAAPTRAPPVHERD